MSHLGAIAQDSVVNLVELSLPYWKQGWASLSELQGDDFTSTLSGNVKVGGVNQVNSKVYIYYRPTGKLIAQLFTDSSGNYEVTGLDSTDIENYFAVAITDHIDDYNALVYDKLTAG